jgi:hypothetical protein
LQDRSDILLANFDLAIARCIRAFLRDAYCTALAAWLFAGAFNFMCVASLTAVSLVSGVSLFFAHCSAYARDEFPSLSATILVLGGKRPLSQPYTLLHLVKPITGLGIGQ